MKLQKCLLILLLLVSCGPTDAEVESIISEEVEQRIIEIDKQTIDICFAITDVIGNNHEFPSMKIFDNKNEIIYFTSQPDLKSEGFFYSGEIGSQWQYIPEDEIKKIAGAVYKISIPTKTEYLRVELKVPSPSGQFELELGTKDLDEIKEERRYFRTLINVDLSKDFQQLRESENYKDMLSILFSACVDL